MARDALIDVIAQRLSTPRRPGKIRRYGDCWIWMGYTNNHYGRIFRDGKQPYVHRLVYEWYAGPIPAEYEVDHLCNRTRCVNPAHLEAVTAAENKRREGKRQTHCLHGHPRTPENRLRNGRYDRCRVCLSEQRQQQKENTNG